MTDAFDADVLIYAATAGHPLGRRVRSLLHAVAPGRAAGVGSRLLVPEVLSRPMRLGDTDELYELNDLLGRLDLVDVDEHTADLAAALGAEYRLRAADAVHLATAVQAGADRFVTNNARDFPRSITEIEIVYPTDLPDPG